MKNKVLALILLLIALPVFTLAGCTSVPAVGGGLTVVMAIPEEFSQFANDITLGKAIVVAKRDGTKIEQTEEIVDQNRIEVGFNSLETGQWTLDVKVVDDAYDDNDNYPATFTASQPVTITNGKMTTAPITLEMAKSTLTVTLSLPTGVSFQSGIVSLLNYEGNASLTRPLTIIESSAAAAFDDISANICNLSVTLYSVGGLKYVAQSANVKILPGKETIVTFTKSDVTLAE